jgi:hypothetical protein
MVAPLGEFINMVVEIKKFPQPLKEGYKMKIISLLLITILAITTLQKFIVAPQSTLDDCQEQGGIAFRLKATYKEKKIQIWLFGTKIPKPISVGITVFITTNNFQIQKL